VCHEVAASLTFRILRAFVVNWHVPHASLLYQLERD
jgi:hypothetical protein